MAGDQPGEGNPVEPPSPGTAGAGALPLLAWGTNIDDESGMQAWAWLEACWRQACAKGSAGQVEPPDDTGQRGCGCGRSRV